MILCWDRIHFLDGPIVYDDTKGRVCPLCAAKTEIENWEAEGAALKERIKELEAKLEEKQ